jgi:hypothetical protein
VETYQMIMVGLGAAVVLFIWLLLRFGRHIARVLPVGGILAVGLVVALAILSQAAASRQAARAAIMTAVARAGIPWTLARTWEGERALERKLKDRHNSPKLCPICQEVDK